MTAELGCQTKEQHRTMQDRAQRAIHLEKCEAIIEKGLQTFVEVGNALLEIRDSRLYRDTHKTFEDYCRKRWQMSRVHAHRLIEAAEVTANLLPIGNTPTHESQVRPLTKLEPEQQREVWEEATEQAGDKVPTAKDVKAAIGFTRNSQN